MKKVVTSPLLVTGSLCRFKRLPFGLNCSPAFFSRRITSMLTPLLRKGFVKNYLGDVIVFALTFPDLLEHLKEDTASVSKIPCCVAATQEPSGGNNSVNKTDMGHSCGRIHRGTILELWENKTTEAAGRDRLVTKNL